MSTNGRTTVLSKEQKRGMASVRSLFNTDKEFCEKYDMWPSQYKYILLTGHASEKTMIKIRNILAHATV